MYYTKRIVVIVDGELMSPKNKWTQKYKSIQL